MLIYNVMSPSLGGYCESPKQEDLILTEDYFCLFFFINKNKSVFVYFIFPHNVLCLCAVKFEFKKVPVDILIEL